MEKPKQFTPGSKPVQPELPAMAGWKVPSNSDELRRQLGWGLIEASRKNA